MPTLSDSGLPSREPTAAHRACIAELVLRFPCPRDTDPDDYAARAELLARDCAGLQSGLLRKACDRAALSAKGLPFASEILAAATAIVEERQAAQARDHQPEQRMASDRERRMREANLRLMEQGRPFRYHGDWQAVSILKPSPAVHADAICNGDGTVTLAEYDWSRRDWAYSRGVGQ